MTAKSYLYPGAITTETIAELLSLNDNKEETGAQACFFGKVRADSFGNDNVVGIDYSAYELMANKEVHRIKQEFLAKYSDLKQVEILHAIGKVPVGETAIAVVVSGGHRKEAFEAVREIVDQIKKHVPIWKRELLDNGEHVWTANA